MQKRYVIDGFESLTPQQCFDIAAKHVLSTGVKCMTRDRVCTYTGVGCAAAPFLTEEGRNTIVGSWSTVVSRWEQPDTNESIIQEVQICHDGSRDGPDFLQDFKKAMICVADNYSLSPAVFDKE